MKGDTLCLTLSVRLNSRKPQGANQGTGFFTPVDRDSSLKRKKSQQNVNFDQWQERL